MVDAASQSITGRHHRPLGRVSLEQLYAYGDKAPAWLLKKPILEQFKVKDNS